MQPYQSPLVIITCKSLPLWCICVTAFVVSSCWLLLGAAGAFIAGYLQNYRNVLAHVSKAAFPLAKAFGQVLGHVSNCVLRT